ncbi:FecR family protein [Paracoccus yeei]|uniref:FecR family protein n=1 Tax=Paracoccus yeei TaxID=147645 RepID=UPI0009E0760D|nr:FecR domain-containing protein [Paracoccus yeei]OWJ95796.1 iron dicitrate transport regulator FecR [Paracoccus yeei]
MTAPRAEDQDDLLLKALEWLVTLQDDAATAADRRAFARWMQHPDHVAAHARAEALWNRFEIVRPEYERMRQAGRIGRRQAMLGLAGVGLALPLGWRLAMRADHATGIGQRASLVLADGSQVELGPDTALDVRMDAGLRRLHLRRGQAHFQVAADPARPFVVRAGAGQIRALGTGFDVNLLDDQVVVAVTEHAVQVSAGDGPPVELRAGWQVSYGGAGIAPGRRADLDAVTAWQRGRLVFDEVPLARVLDALGRYRHGRILLIDDSLGALPVSAVIDTADAGAALHHLAASLPIRLRTLPGIATLVDRRPGS